MLLGGIVICNQAGGLACGRVRHVPGELAAAHQLELTSFASPTLLWPPSTPPPRSRRAARATRRSLRRARVVVVQVEGAFAARPLDITVVRLTVVVDLLHLRVQQDLASARACVTVADFRGAAQARPWAPPPAWGGRSRTRVRPFTSKTCGCKFPGRWLHDLAGLRTIVHVQDYRYRTGYITRLILMWTTKHTLAEKAHAERQQSVRSCWSHGQHREDVDSHSSMQ